MSSSTFVSCGKANGSSAPKSDALMQLRRSTMDATAPGRRCVVSLPTPCPGLLLGRTPNGDGPVYGPCVAPNQEAEPRREIKRMEGQEIVGAQY